MKKFDFYKQHDQNDCGPACLRMISKYHGKKISQQKLRELSGINRDGISMLGISEAAEQIGFRTSGGRIMLEQLYKMEQPTILHWNQNHFVVMVRSKNKKLTIADPSKGIIEYSEAAFTKHWESSNRDGISQGIILTITPTPEFYTRADEDHSELGLGYLVKYLFQYKQLILQLLVGLGIGSIIQLILPLLTQSLVDVGINGRNINFIYVILIAQVMLFLGRLSVEFLRSWILLHVSTRINIAILVDFLIKLMKLPLSYFDTKNTGDIMQRMQDQKRIESFITGPTLNMIFTLFNMVVFTAVLCYYDTGIFLIFMASAITYSIWVAIFLKKRRKLDFERFDISSKNQSTVVQLIAGMQEIKLNNCEQSKRWEWERIQAGLFRFNIKNLALNQYQQIGSFFINEGKNIFITFLVAKSVVDGNLTLGGMMAVQYMVGQLNSPIEQLIGFIQQIQDTKISLERLNEIRSMDDEEPAFQKVSDRLPVQKNISLHNVSFTYDGAGNEPVLSDINLDIPEGKTTAIVGMSGSGKTTLLKLLLRFYSSYRGDIQVGNSSITNLSHKFWRSQCGIVTQEGFIFSDSIARNIAVSDEEPDMEQLQHAMKVANIHEYVNTLPLGINTKIGAEGNGLSQGQKQRILIARSVYKNPKFIFFDEATNALDGNNEKIILENLEHFFVGRTVVVVAHRLSTVRHADNIVVMDKGRIIENGTHEQLTKSKGKYYELVKNQLELAS